MKMVQLESGRQVDGDGKHLERLGSLKRDPSVAAQWGPACMTSYVRHTVHKQQYRDQLPLCFVYQAVFTSCIADIIYTGWAVISKNVFVLKWQEGTGCPAGARAPEVGMLNWVGGGGQVVSMTC